MPSYGLPQQARHFSDRTTSPAALGVPQSHGALRQLTRKLATTSMVQCRWEGGEDLRTREPALPHPSLQDCRATRIDPLCASRGKDLQAGQLDAQGTTEASAHVTPPGFSRPKAILCGITAAEGAPLLGHQR